MYSVMWSEHCSYKSSKVHLRQFGEKAPRSRRRCWSASGENAGVVDVGEGCAVTFKIESHNHPSYVEPYQGAATGVGGIVRDILAMGARPVAVMDPLRFGPADAAGHPPGAARRGRAASAATATAWACPTSAARSSSTPATRATRWSTRCAWACMRHDDIKLAKATGPGNKVVLFGARTGRDGIGGASVLASATFGGDGEPAKRPSVQVGDPFMEKLLIECCLEIFAAGPGRRHPGPRRGRAVLRDHRAGRGRHRRHATSSWTWCRCATRRWGPRRS